jgi:cytidine deaminase
MAGMNLEELVNAARDVRVNAHAPYSKFRVGAAVLGASGNVYVGCNVENATYGATICAERAAVCAMIAAGETKAKAIAVYTDCSPVATPCGICRQVLSEFAEDMPIILAGPGQHSELSLAALLPNRFIFNPKDAE